MVLRGTASVFTEQYEDCHTRRHKRRWDPAFDLSILRKQMEVAHVIDGIDGENSLLGVNFLEEVIAMSASYPRFSRRSQL